MKTNKKAASKEAEGLPQDLSDLEAILNQDRLKSLLEASHSTAIKILFLNGSEPLDVYFLVSWLISKKLENIHIDFISTDPIVLKKTAEGLFTKNEIDSYCQSQLLQSYLHCFYDVNGEKCRIDPKLSFKIQFKWDEDFQKGHLEKQDYQIVIIGNNNLDCDGEYYLEKNATYSIEMPNMTEKHAVK